MKKSDFISILEEVVKMKGVKGLELGDLMIHTTYKHRFDAKNKRYIGLHKTIKKKLVSLWIIIYSGSQWYFGARTSWFY